MRQGGRDRETARERGREREREIERDGEIEREREREREREEEEGREAESERARARPTDKDQKTEGERERDFNKGVRSGEKTPNKQITSSIQTHVHGNILRAVVPLNPLIIATRQHASEPSEDAGRLVFCLEALQQAPDQRRRRDGKEGCQGALETDFQQTAWTKQPAAAGTPLAKRFRSLQNLSLAACVSLQ